MWCNSSDHSAVSVAQIARTFFSMCCSLFNEFTVFPFLITDTSLKDGLFHEYKKHGKVTVVKVIGQGTERYAVVCFKK